jgi:hypothetical protein
MFFELFENLLMWCQPQRRRWRDRTFVAQYRQPSLERWPATRLNGVSANSVPEVSLDQVLVDVSQLVATLCHPVQEAANHIEAKPSTVVSKPLFRQPPSIALDKLSVRPILETLKQVASSQVIVCFHLCPPLLTAGTQHELCRTYQLPISVNAGTNEATRHSLPGGIVPPMPRAA